MGFGSAVSAANSLNRTRQEPAHFPRSRALRVLFGPTFRPPLGVLWQLRRRVDDTVEEYAAEARRHPLFELRAADDLNTKGR
jgi:hypothetical protein